MPYSRVVARNASLRGGIDDGGTAAADLRQWERELGLEANVLRIAESTGVHPEQVADVIAHVLDTKPTAAPWMDYADGLAAKPDGRKPQWLKLF